MRFSVEYRVGYLYGKMKQKEKDEIMQDFKDGKIRYFNINNRNRSWG